MVPLARARLLLARHPAARWSAVAGLAVGAGWLTFSTASPTTCPAPVVAAHPQPSSALSAGEVAVPLRAVPGATAGTAVRLFSLAEPLADGRVVALVGNDMLVAVPDDRAGEVSFAATEGSVTAGLVGVVETVP